MSGEARIAAPCTYCWIDDVNAECPEHGEGARKDREIARLRAALASNQWGSCDGCSNGHHYCPECKAPREWWAEDAEEAAPGVHFAPCSIAVALNLPLRTK